jgi:hypothetical protein
MHHVFLKKYDSKTIATKMLHQMTRGAFYKEQDIKINPDAP